MGPFFFPLIKLILNGGGRDSFKPKHGWKIDPHKVQKVSISLYVNMGKVKTLSLETDLSKVLNCLND